MAWYKTGTVSVQNGETSITGVSTKFASNTRVGDGFRGPDGEWYEIVNIASETTLGIYPGYQGATVSASPNYMVAPLQGYNKESADRLRAITDQFKDLDAEVAAAAASAAAAKTSETNSKTSETNSKTSETNALASKNAAANSATAADTSKTAAAASQTAAGNSATAASTSAANALTEANRAKTEADRATAATDGKQPLNANLTAFSALTGAADRLPYFTGAGALSIAAITAKARALLARTDTAGMQAELALVPVTSNTDITAGRLVVPGWMGFGSLSGLPLPGANADVNTLASGRYSTTATWTGSPYPGTNGLNQGYLEVHPWEANNYVKQTWSSIIAGVATYVRYKVNNVWGSWTPFFDPNNSVADPSTGFGLMSMTTVSGFTVFKYLNGQQIVQGPVPTTATIAANTQFTVSVAIPVTFPVGNVTLVGTLYPSVGNDFAIRNTQAPGSTAYLFCANGVSAQTFSGNIMLVGRWK